MGKYSVMANIAACLFFIAAVISFVSDSSMGVLWLCLGSSFLCIGSVHNIKNKKQKDKDDK